MRVSFNKEDNAKIGAELQAQGINDTPENRYLVADALQRKYQGNLIWDIKVVLTDDEVML